MRRFVDWFVPRMGLFYLLCILALLLPPACSSADDRPQATPTPPKPTIGYGMAIEASLDFQKSLTMSKDAGFDWVKIQVRWENQEAQKGKIDWNLADIAVEETSKRNMKLLLSVVTAPKWARPQNTDFSVPGPPADPKDYADYVGAIARRHKGKVQAYEIWNEQNLWYEWGGKDKRLSATQYLEILKSAYKAIKEADPEAIVVSGALTPTGVDDGNLAYDDVRYLKMMYDAGLKDYSDAIGAHPSGYNNPPDDDPSKNSTKSTNYKGHWSFYYRRFEQYYDVMKQYGDGDKKLWFTEFGWASIPDPVPDYSYAKDISEEDQAKYLVQAFEIAKEKGYVGVMFLWNLNYAPGIKSTDTFAMKAFSIIRPDWSPRPAYNALRNMSK